MAQIGWLFCLPILILSIQSCPIIDILQMNSSNVIFTGRILSLHRWSADHPYSAFVWVFRILRGESYLLEHYQSTHLQRPLYIIIDNLGICEENSPLKYYDVKIFGIQINNARFQSSFTPLPVTVANMQAIEVPMSTVTTKSYVVAVDQHQQSKSRKFLRILLLFVGIVILVAALFLAIGNQRKSLTVSDSNNTELIYNQSSQELRSARTCEYGRTLCEAQATCTEQNECRCIFNCDDDDEPVQDVETRIISQKQCQLDEAACNSHYQQSSLEKGK
ncbi:unnamed protein product [Adineta steineri]|uniref:NtA domain-containing protein n=1 Tax=Adineta steineri TaxID=433720 RepID=A0A815S3Q3_9BILA|nr:unnamed protein product [Adineta steineri]CAF3631861.1 unnamed protein product [Adineta steineri]